MKKVVILHLSDMHIKADGSMAINRLRQISPAIRDSFRGTVPFIVLSGDVAYSGKEQEYSKAMEFLDSVLDQTESDIGKRPLVLMVPGNHDCDFERGARSVREAAIEKALAHSESIDEDLMRFCCEPQSCFFDFRMFYADETHTQKGDQLFVSYRHKVEGIEVVFNCYNTAWMSTLHESPGRLYFPVQRYELTDLEKRADLVVSLLHHPRNWFTPANGRVFDDHLQLSSDIVITGHEHTGSASSKYDMHENCTSYFEGEELQGTGSGDRSAFNVIEIDLESNVQRAITFRWTQQMLFSPSADTGNVSFSRFRKLEKDRFRPSHQFSLFLKDPGAKFAHPRLSELSLEDIFIQPNLKELKVAGSPREQDYNRIVSAVSLLEDQSYDYKYMITGDERSGKTTVCKTLFKKSLAKGYIAIYLEGQRLKSPSLEDIARVIQKAFEEQYNPSESEQFRQESPEKKILIIDDFDESPMNSKYRTLLLGRLSTLYPNTIITGKNLLEIEEVVGAEGGQAKLLSKYTHYELMEFGHLLRSELIDKWNRLGAGFLISEEQVEAENDEATQLVNTIIGHNYVPSYPIFLVTILQAKELGVPHDLKESSYGYYYDLLIMRAMAEAQIARNDEIDVYSNYMSELCNYIYEKRMPEVSEEEMRKFNSMFCKEYAVRLDYSTMMSKLLQARILQIFGQNYRIRYKYVYFYFVARHMANNMSDPEIRRRIANMIERVHKQEFANIVMFLTHLTKDPFVLDKVLDVAKHVFAGHEPVKLEDDIKCVNELIEEIPKLVLEKIDVRENRKKMLKRKDQFETSDAENDSEEDSSNLQDSLNEYDLITQLNIAFKTIEIIGQILKNYFGSLRSIRKYDLAQECYFIGLRALNDFFTAFAKATDFFVEEISAVLDRKKIYSRDKVRERSRRMLFGMCTFIVFVFIKKISNSLGTKNLAPTFLEILENHGYASTRMIDLSIKLDFYRSFPYADISRIVDMYERNPLIITLVRQMVINYLYMFRTTLTERQQICNKLGIEMSEQRKIEIGSKRRKT